MSRCASLPGTAVSAFADGGQAQDVEAACVSAKVSQRVAAPVPADVSEAQESGAPDASPAELRTAFIKGSDSGRGNADGHSIQGLICLIYRKRRRCLKAVMFLKIPCVQKTKPV